MDMLEMSDAEREEFFAVAKAVKAVLFAEPFRAERMNYTNLQVAAQVPWA